jgi:hypothetical protein
MRKAFTLIGLLISLNSLSNTYYVNRRATGTNSGSSWANAFTNLRHALAVAHSGDFIKVAAGTYNSTSNSYSDSTFDIPRGVTLLGGYPNTGNPSDAQRNWGDQPTIFADSLYVGKGMVVISNVDTATVLDGFVIRTSSGSGNQGSLMISNSIHVTGNHLLFQRAGTAIFTDKSQATFSECVLDSNNAWSNAVVYVSDSSHVDLYNCVFSANYSTTSSFVVNNLNSTMSLINCTLVNGQGPVFHGSGGGSSTLRNCIFWNNLGSYQESRMAGVDIIAGNQQLDVQNCITQSYSPNGVNNLLVNYNPRFLNIANPAGTDNKWFTADDGLQLTAPCSPGLNAGDNSAVAGIGTDILDRPRISNATVDLGAYEFQGSPGIPLRTIYVNAAATGKGDGSSWQNAFKTLQQALLYCADTIKMAAGVYITDNSMVDSTFSVQNKTVILGGYPSTGSPTEAQRDPSRNQTLLNGNFPNGGSAGYPVLTAIHCDSTTLIDGLAFSNQTASQEGAVETLYIAYGSNLRVNNCRFFAEGNDAMSGAGIHVAHGSSPLITRSNFNTHISNYSAGGISCDSSSPIIRNCYFESNPNSVYAGWAILFQNCTGVVDSCQFVTLLSEAATVMVRDIASHVLYNNCLFDSYDGTSLSCSSKSAPVLNNCVFMNKGFFAAGSCIYNDNSNPVFNRCRFDSSNLAVKNLNYSAPVFNNCVSLNSQFMQNTRSFPVVNNSTIVNTYRQANAVYNAPPPDERELIDNSDSTVFRANNTIFWGHQLTSGAKDINDAPAGQGGSTSILQNCITRNYGVNGVNGNKVGVNPRFVQVENQIGPDNQMFTADDGLRLMPCSPAINAGNNALGNLLGADVLSNPRIVGDTVDIGAYEYQLTNKVPNSYYVNKNATGGNNGTSWQNAYTEFQTAVCNACADTIRVAAGTYLPAVTARDSAFLVDRVVTMLGGYPSSGSPQDRERDPAKYPTILSGNVGNPADSTDNSKNVLIVQSVPDTVVIDGFTIRDGNMKGGGPISIGGTGGAGLYLYNTNTIVRNCQFINNVAVPYGGAITNGGLTYCAISHSIFVNNSSSNEGGAIASPYGGWYRINNCAFEHNSTTGIGGAVQVGGISDVRDCVFYANFSTATNGNGGGGAIDASKGANIINCTFVKNSSASKSNGAGAIYTGQSQLAGGLTAILHNCVFYGNTVAGSTLAASADMDWSYYNTVFNTLFQVPRQNLQTAPHIMTGVYPVFIDTLHPKGKDGVWLTPDDGLQLSYGSPAIDWGDNASVKDSLDAAGEKRIHGPAVDAGAYEFQDLPYALAGSDTTICVNDTIRIGRLSDPAFQYSWTSNPAGFTSNEVIPLIQPTATTSYFLTVTDGATISRDTIQVNTTQSLTPSIYITADTNTICQGALVHFTAFPSNGGSVDSIRWQVNGIDSGRTRQFSSRTLSDGSQVKAILTSSLSCATQKSDTSAAISMKVNPVLMPSLTITQLNPVVCASQNDTFIAHPVAGGIRPIYTWYDDEGAKSGPGDTLVMTFLDTFYNKSVTMTSNYACASPKTVVSNSFVVRPHRPVYLSISISASATTICKGDEARFTSMITNTGPTPPAYQWMINGVNQGINLNTFNSTSLNNGDLVSAALISKDTCPSPPSIASNAIRMTVNSSTVEPAVQLHANTTVKPGQDVLVTTTYSNAGLFPTFQWQDSTQDHGWLNINPSDSSSIHYVPQATGAAVRCILTSSSTACLQDRTVTSAPLVFTVKDITGSSPGVDSGYHVIYYPNPASSILTVDSLYGQWQSLEIRALDGRSRVVVIDIANQRQVHVDISGLPKGLYILCLFRNSGNNFFKKLLKI